jgi:RNA polymerase sigma-70 factor (ECF subfamily)
VRDPSDAQDLLQEVYLRLLSHARPERIRSPRAYIFRVAANITREHWRKRSGSLPHVELTDELSETLAAPEEAAAMLERIDQLARMLVELSPPVGAALIWAHRDGHTYGEISARLAVPKSRVKKYLARARARCRKSEMTELAD